MLLGSRNQTVGNRRRYIVDYSQWLDPGLTVASGTAVVAALPVTTMTVDTVSVNPEGWLVFFVNNGTLGDTPTVNIQITDSKGQIKNDTMTFTVVAA